MNSRRRFVRLLATAVLAGSGLTVAVAGPAGAAVHTVTFSTPGAVTFVVPATVTTLQIVKICGASGGWGGGRAAGEGGPGGNASCAAVPASITVVPGETLSLTVAGAGGMGSCASSGDSVGGAGGIGGGGSGGAGGGFDNLDHQSCSGGGGGGASRIRRGAANVVVAPGGGGGGGDAISVIDPFGPEAGGSGGEAGANGPLAGGDGGSGSTTFEGTGGGAGHGATTTTAGPGGFGAQNSPLGTGDSGATGTSASGGAGGPSSSDAGAGGGGGGGLLGGGGGGGGDGPATGGGGGAGSARYPGGASGNASFSNGIITLSYTQPAYRPDALVRRELPTKFTGNNKYYPTLQQVTANVGAGSSVKFRVRVETDGDVVDSFRVKGTAGSGSFTVSYVAGPYSVTNQMTGAGLMMNNVAPGQFRDVLVTVKAASTTPHGASKTVDVSVRSMGAQQLVDQVRIKVTHP